MEKHLIVPYMPKPDGTGLYRVAGGWVHYVSESDALRIANEMRASAVKNTEFLLREQGLSQIVARSLAPQKAAAFFVEKG